MAQSIVRGNPITLEVRFFDGNDVLADATAPKVSIVNRSGVTVVNLDDPIHVSTGVYQYVYNVPPTADPGAWEVRWQGTVDEFFGTAVEGFTVIAASSLVAGTTCSPWVTHEDAPDSLQEYGIDPDDVDEAFQAACDVLFELTGRTYPGECTDIIRPQAQWWRSADPLPRWWPAGSFQGTSWWGWCSCHRGRETGCNRLSEIRLPGHPVVEGSVSVLIDGEAFEDFVLHDNRFLVRTDGGGWPCCQDMRLPDSELHTFSVAYSYGSVPDVGGLRAAVLLGTSLFADYHPDEAARCTLPKRATRVTRQGVSVEILTPEQMVKEGLTGIRAVDMWVASKRYGRIHRRTAVLVPGRNRSARRTP